MFESGEGENVMIGVFKNFERVDRRGYNDDELEKM